MINKLLIFIFLPCATFAQSILRGPYLQQTGPTSTYISWKTSTPSNSKVIYGLSKATMNQVVYINNLDTNHCNYLPNLQPNTKYYYLVNVLNSVMSSDTNYFYTAPPIGSGQKMRFVALGDCGTGYQTQLNVKNAVMNYKKNNYINGILLLGDNAYYSGLEPEYQTGFFNPYKTNFIFSNSCIYPSPGNHDYGNTNALALTHAVPYFDIFNKVPQNAQLGGLASNHKEFYSYNYGNVHFISLDSYGIELSTYSIWDSLGPQYQWLEQDLQQDHSMWKVVYFHHPPFTMGSHNSDTEGDLALIRQNVARLLEKYNVDLVLNGHSHSYERSWLQKGHFGVEATFSKVLHTVDSSSAKYDGTTNSCPYKKDTIDNKGTVYVIAGAAGKLGGVQSTYPHDSKYFSDVMKGGAVVLEVEGNRLDAFYIEEDSLVHDKFTIFKNVNNTKSINSFANQFTTLTASWPGTYNWLFNNQHTQSQTVSINQTTQFIVKDSLNCFADTFNIVYVGVKENQLAQSLLIYPNPVKDKIELHYKNITSELSCIITNELGQQVLQTNLHFINGDAHLNLNHLNLPNASYFLTLKILENYITKSILINR